MALSFVLSACNVDTTLMATPPTSVVDWGVCDGIAALPDAPIIDGRLEASLTLAPFFPVPSIDGGPIVFPGTASLAVGWHPSGLYVFAEIDQPSLSPAEGNQFVFCGDAFELFVDSDGQFTQDYDTQGTRQFVIGAPDPSSGGVRVEVYRDTIKIDGQTLSHFVARPTTGGYAVEALVTAGDLGLSSWPLAAGTHIGLNAAVDFASDAGLTDGGGCGSTRLGQFSLRLARGQGCVEPACNVQSFCRPLIL